MREIAAIFAITDTLPSTVKPKAALAEFNTTTAQLPTHHTVNNTTGPKISDLSRKENYKND